MKKKGSKSSLERNLIPDDEDSDLFKSFDELLLGSEDPQQIVSDGENNDENAQDFLFDEKKDKIDPDLQRIFHYSLGPAENHESGEKAPKSVSRHRLPSDRLCDLRRQSTVESDKLFELRI
jgi:hypothetical protein